MKITFYGSENCPYCHKEKEVIKELRSKHPDWKIKEVDIDKVKKDIGIDAVPTLICCTKNKVCKTLVGFSSADEVEKAIQG